MNYLILITLFISLGCIHNYSVEASRTSLEFDAATSTSSNSISELRNKGERISEVELVLVKDRMIEIAYRPYSFQEDTSSEASYYLEEAPFIYVGGMIKDNTQELEIFMKELKTEVTHSIDRGGLSNRSWDKKNYQDQVFSKKLSLYHGIVYAVLRYSYEDEDYEVCFNLSKELLGFPVSSIRRRGLTFLQLLYCKDNYEEIIDESILVDLEQSNREIVSGNRDDLISSKLKAKSSIRAVQEIRECLKKSK